MKQWFGKLLLVFAIEFEKFEERVTNLLKEAIPGLSRELLPEWETDLGLPDACSTPVQSEAERAQIAHSKYVTPNTGQSKQFYIDYAALLGATITVTEFVGIGAAFRVDVNRVDRMPGAAPPPDRIFGSRLWGIGSKFKWIVTFVSITGNVSRENIECLIRQKAPAHTEVYFNP
jgi:uncharacterized protein YmfQ (DUF2313 family)